MRQERTVQASIFDLFAEHEIGRELKAMSLWLDEHRDLIGLVAEDLRRRGVTETGRQGLPAESVLRCGLLKQHRQLSHQELAWHCHVRAFYLSTAPGGRLPTRAKSIICISASRTEIAQKVAILGERDNARGTTPPSPGRGDDLARLARRQSLVGQALNSPCTSVTNRRRGRSSLQRTLGLELTAWRGYHACIAL